MKSDEFFMFLAFCVGVIVMFVSLRGLAQMKTQHEWCEQWAMQTVDKPFKESYEFCQNHLDGQKR